ncbi:MAG: carboxypeptidase regulatory-like domain-containing protein [Gemmatimonadota bacterium]
MLKRRYSVLMVVAWTATTASFGYSQQAPAYNAREVEGGGQIIGSVTVTGTLPAPTRLEVTKDHEVCGAEPKVAEDLLVKSGTNGLRNAVVSLSDITEGKPFGTQSEPRALDQRGCRFAPHVLVVPAGAPFAVLNSDGILHNFSTRSSENRPINKAQPGMLKKLQVKFRQPERIRVECDIHEWMEAWIVVAAHPYYAVTDENGSYQLEEVPPGRYTLEVWHERLGTQTRQVTIPDAGKVRVDVELEAR